MKVYATTDVGQRRNINQDYVYTSLEPVGCLSNIFIVADGMGGHKAGDVASRYTVNTLKELIADSEKKDPIMVINDAIAYVNKGVIRKAGENDDYAGMGTTLVLATIDNNMLKVANIGDSRLYIIGDDIKQITRDHSYVEELVNAGEINRVQARTHEKKNYITRAIGADIDVEPEMFSVELNKDDKILMCSDGLTNMLEDSEIYEIIAKYDDIETAGKELVSKANSNGGYDNISVVIIEL